MPGQTAEAGTGVGPSVFPLRPLGLAEVLDAAVTVTRTYPKAILAPSLLVYGGAFALLLGLTSLVTAVAYTGDNSFIHALEIGAGAAPPPDELGPALADRYIALKATGRL